jgi:hypothetical protein
MNRSETASAPAPKLKTELHPESLLRVPLLRQAILDPQCRIRARAIDQSWFYAKRIPVSVTGFNPLLATVFIANHSSVSNYLKNPVGSSRDLNMDDQLVREALFGIAHDYLHCWSYLAIQNLCPEIGFGTAPITEERIEDFAFCHLLTEAVATVGLDYWYMATVDLNEVAPLGTEVVNFTTSYHERHLAEYGRMIPGFEGAQQPDFFARIAELYCDPVFHGLRLSSPEVQARLKRSPRTWSWLNSELSYGENQRWYIRLWLRYLGGLPMSDAKGLGRSLSFSEPWRRRLIQELGALLWEKVKSDAMHRFASTPDPDRLWRSPRTAPIDTRFTNLNGLGPEDHAPLAARFRQASHIERKIESSKDNDVQFNYLYYQLLSTFDYAAFDKDLLPALEPLRKQKDLKALQRLLKDQKPCEPPADPEPEPRDLFLLN